MCEFQIDLDKTKLRLTDIDGWHMAKVTLNVWACDWTDTMNGI